MKTFFARQFLPAREWRSDRNHFLSAPRAVVLPAPARKNPAQLQNSPPIRVECSEHRDATRWEDPHPPRAKVACPRRAAPRALPQQVVSLIWREFRVRDTSLGLVPCKPPRTPRSPQGNQRSRVPPHAQFLVSVHATPGCAPRPSQSRDLFSAPDTHIF